MLMFADGHPVWIVFLGHRATTVASIQAHRRKCGVLSKGNFDGCYIIARCSRACQMSSCGIKVMVCENGYTTPGFEVVHVPLVMNKYNIQ
jgi:hypothetical protein